MLIAGYVDGDDKDEAIESVSWDQRERKRRECSISWLVLRVGFGAVVVSFWSPRCLLGSACRRWWLANRMKTLDTLCVEFLAKRASKYLACSKIDLNDQALWCVLLGVSYVATHSTPKQTNAILLLLSAQLRLLQSTLERNKNKRLNVVLSFSMFLIA